MEEHILILLKKVSTMRELKKVHTVITKTGQSANLLILTKLLICTALPVWGSLEHAQSIYQITVHQNDPILCNTMIRAYSNSIFPMEAINLYNVMYQRAVRTDHLTYPFLLRACGRVGRTGSGRFDGGRKSSEVHSRIWKLGFGVDVFVMNCLMFGYTQWERLKDAREVFDGMSVRNVASWNTIIAAYDRCSEYELADALMDRMPEKNVVTWNCFLGRHIRLGKMEMAKKVFDSMPQKDAGSWSSIISGYISVKDYKSALELFGSMQSNLIKPTELTYVSIIGACAKTGSFNLGKQIHEHINRNGLVKIEGYIGIALLDMYAKSGNLRCAKQVFDEMKMKHITCWNAMIVGLAVNGHCTEALELFSKLEEEPDGGAYPNSVSFLGVLLACSHKGLVKEGQSIFHKMVWQYKIKPDVKHYGCMVDILSRGGMLAEARSMMKTMPFCPNCVMWRSILGGCRVHGDLEIAEEAFREICALEVVPNHGDCLLLSNVYAEFGRWDDLLDLKRRISEWGLISRGFGPGPGFGFSRVEG
ncbi:Pentatricopeptide repeat-containing protein [Zostera marina]|uniref:Pentatricopeptide repeat-containing protein n=1 Tax=Zostera marina TaxID=29655 RepID=A0A0K9PNQ8_ZOSMR|nr:Pentatricopeptide repeat-containing protein [Zostera marina]